MALRDYVPVDVASVPETFEYDIEGETFEFTFYYNDEGDYFTVDIADENGELLCRGEKLVINRELWANIYDDRLPATPLVPMDESGVSTYCGIDEFMKTVFLYEDDVDPDGTDIPAPIVVDEGDDD
ncbi:phage baseplate plug family protein [Levilactobacillus sp. HBUAS70063]|uniref:phage baseplate plug family protein n=1 Tax=Levilactobacillus sp. HBUAS70063 TaxID=3109359 RepID=UPI00313302FB